MNNTSKGIFNVLIAAIISIAEFLIVKYAFITSPELRPMDFFWWGFIRSFFLSSLIVLPQKRYHLEIKNQLLTAWKLHLSLVILTIIACYLFFYAVQEANVGLVAVLSKSDTIFALLLGVLFLGEVIKKIEILLIAIVVIGFLTLSSLSGEVTSTVIFAILLSRLLYSIQSLLVKKYANALDSVVLAYLRGSLITMFVSIIYFSCFDFRIFSLFTIFLLVISQFIAVFFERIFYFEAHKYIGVGIIHIFLLITPVGTLIFSVLFFNEPLSLQKVFGAVLIILGLACLYFYHNRATMLKRRELIQ